MTEMPVNKIHYYQQNRKLLCGAKTNDNFSASKIYAVNCEKCLEIYISRYLVIKTAIDNFMNNMPENFKYFCEQTYNIMKDIEDFRGLNVEVEITMTEQENGQKPLF